MVDRTALRRRIARALRAAARTVDPGGTAGRGAPAGSGRGPAGSGENVEASSVGRSGDPGGLTASRPAAVVPVPPGIDPATEPRVEVRAGGPTTPARTAAEGVAEVIRGEGDGAPTESGAWTHRRDPIEVEY